MLFHQNPVEHELKHQMCRQPHTWNMVSQVMRLKYLVQCLVTHCKKQRLMERLIPLQVTTTAMKQFQSMRIQVFLVYVFCFKTLSGEEIPDEVRQNQAGVVVVPVYLLVDQKMGKEVQTVSKIQLLRLSGATWHRTIVSEDCS